ncbi:AmmeMemoRadiSam system protein B [Candidatus Woesearchaeota archaeon]|nr:AmmeMemoRadiSam system protein B [Candidatus Woesearchaeota archaeon]
MQKKKVRDTAVAGSWYPGDMETLQAAVDTYLGNVRKADFNGTVRAVIVPHAGYSFSGQVAAVAFRQLNSDHDKVILLGPSHHYPLSGASILDVTHYKTPLGEVKLSKTAKRLLKEEMINNVPEAHAEEHSLEIELPFLQQTLGDFELVPVLVGSVEPDAFADILGKHIDDSTLLVVSVDMSHYHSYDEAKQLDYYALDRILNLDSEGIFKAEIDAPSAVSTLLKIAQRNGWKPYILYYANSGDVSGNMDSVVGYSAIAFISEGDKGSTARSSDNDEPLTAEDQGFLLGLARETAEQYLKTGKMPEVDEEKLTPALKEVKGCFTTFNKDHNLRGCIGHILPQEELYKCVMDNAVSAAVNDRRFEPVVYDEMEDINIEISVLTVPQRLEFSSGEDLLDKLRPMVDGVVLKQGYKQSTYLPQVWANFGAKDEFLLSLCRKGGMLPDCWEDTSTEVYTYQAFVFEE